MISLAQNALTTLETLKFMLELDQADTERDTDLIMQINSYSEQLAGRCGRDFNIKTETVTLEGNGTKTLLLPNYPVIAITIENVNDFTASKAGELLRLSGKWEYGAKYRIEYTHGYVLPKDHGEDTPRTLPFEIEKSVVKLIGIEMEMRGSEHLKSEKIGPLSNDFLTEWPHEVMETVNRYRRFDLP